MSFNICSIWYFEAFIYEYIYIYIYKYLRYCIHHKTAVVQCIINITEYKTGIKFVKFIVEVYTIRFVL